MIGLIDRSQADFSSSALSIMGGRNDAVDFSIPVGLDRSKLYMRKPRQSFSFRTFASVFDTTYSLLLIATILILSWLFGWLFLYAGRSLPERLAMSTTSVFLAVLALDAERPVGKFKRWSRRSLFFVSLE